MPAPSGGWAPLCVSQRRNATRIIGRIGPDPERGVCATRRPLIEINASFAGKDEREETFAAAYPHMPPRETHQTRRRNGRSRTLSLNG